MVENLDKEAQKIYTFDAICFSTHPTSFDTKGILSQYLMSAICSDIDKQDENKVSFGHKLSIGEGKEIDCKNSYFEISLSKKGVKIENNTDCFIIFLDLEYKDSLSELNKILKNLQKLSINDQRLYIVTFYTDEKQLNKKLKEDNIVNQLDNLGFINYNIYKMNLYNPDEIIKTIDTITLETLQDKKLINFQNLEGNVHKSESFCAIN